uniref:Rop4 n=1 Tax=Arundo donax TaxID=35708 RepID=A0A0A9CYL5_ARUDO
MEGKCSLDIEVLLDGNNWSQVGWMARLVLVSLAGFEDLQMATLARCSGRIVEEKVKREDTSLC